MKQIFSDLFGLFAFLRVDPYQVKLWWNKFLYEPYCYSIKEPMHLAVSNVLWRTAKKDVLDQVGS